MRMVSYLSNLLGSLWSESQPAKTVYTTDDYNSVLFSEESEKKNLEKDEEVELKINVNEGQRRIGKITVIQDTYGLIDDKYYFDLEDVVEKDVSLAVGQPVKYFTYKPDERTDWRIKQVSIYLTENNWDGDSSPTEVESRVLSQNTVISKAITLKVEEKEKRMVHFSNGYECNLDKVRSEFLPISGDWVTLQADVEMCYETGKLPQERIVEVHKLEGVRPRTYYGKITHVDKDNYNVIAGIINREVYFRKENCESGYIPKINDTVMAKVIDSDQGTLASRAIFVLAVSSFNPKFSSLANIEEQKLFESKHGVSLSVECENNSLKINEKTTFTIKIENAGTEKQILCRAQLRALKHCMRLVNKLEEPLCIHASECKTLTVEAVARGLGSFTDVLLLYFTGNWSMACLLDYYVDVEGGFEQSNAAVTSTSKPALARFTHRAQALQKIATKTGFCQQNFVPGRKTVKPNAFIPNRLEFYRIPQQIKDVYLFVHNGVCRKNDDIRADFEKLYPYLIEELNERNYKDKFNTLLHMEDLEMEIVLKKYDRERACFVHKGEYLGLEIENLAESRPSLAIGDKLIASDPLIFRQNEQNVVPYSAYIHKILHNTILLQFNESFHKEYNGKDYKIEFSHNRSPIRRCHQALNHVSNHLPSSWLFPDTLGDLKPAQVNIVGEMPAESVEEAHQCESIGEKKPKASTSKSTLGEMLRVMQSDANETGDGRPNVNASAESVNEHEYSRMKETKMTQKILWEEGKTRRENGVVDAEDTVPILNGVKPQDVIVRWINPNLNLYQKRAIRNILKGVARPLPYVINGPPGTGKTMTVVETALQIVHLMPESRILIATPSNSSADLICERMLSWNLSLIRPGNLMRLAGFNYMMENRMPDRLKPYASVIDMETREKEYRTCDSDGIIHSTRESIGRSRITIGTCVSLGTLYSLGFPKNHFTHIIIDEAGQATEPEIMIPIAFLSKENQVILAGDPKQLGPVVVSSVAKSFGLDVSFLHRLQSRYLYQQDEESYPDTDGFDPRLVTRLLINYRSLPEILQLYGKFYGDRLIPKICPKCSPEAKLLEKLKPELKQSFNDQTSGVIFHGVRGSNRQDDDSPSWYNDTEVCTVQQYLIRLFNLQVSPDDIGIITPYQKQVMRLREQFRACGLEELPKIGTVEEFQGQERQVIIISTVRSDVNLLERDKKHALGFVSCTQRLNVAISRARALLIIVGNPHLLAMDQAWKELIIRCRERGCVVGCDLPNSCLP